jgi:integrase
MSVFLRGQTWWFEFQFEGRRIRESSHSTSKKVCERKKWATWEALNAGRQGMAERAKPKKFGGDGKKRPAGAAIPAGAAKAYLTEREAHWSPKTRDMHANSLRHLQESFAKKLLTEIKGEDISRYQSARHKEGASNRTINIEINLVRLVLGKHKFWSSISDEVHMLKERQDVGRALSADEVHRLLTACRSSVSRGLYPAVLTSIHTGLRSSELRLLRWRQIDLIEGVITVGKSKTEGGEGRLAYLSDTAAAVLKEWRSRLPDAQPGHAVFPREAYGLKGKKGVFGGKVVPYKTYPDQPIRSFATAWRAVQKVSGVRCRWHDLRHSAVQAVAAGGAMDATLQAMFGWMSPKMIERYSHVRNEAKKAAVRVFDVGTTPASDSPQKSPQSPSRDDQNFQ